MDAFSGVAEGAGWEEEGEEDPLGTKYPYVVHAEANALLNKNSASVSGAVGCMRWRAAYAFLSPPISW